MPTVSGTDVYASAHTAYWQAGWTCVIPVPPDKKHPPPEGFTGAAGRDAGPEDMASWAASLPHYSVALRMPDGLIGIDVDQYLKGEVQKHGAETLAKKIAEWGPLPPTYSSTARGEGQPSRIWFFQVPPGRYAGTIDPDIEIIQRHHRYAVVAPSFHAGAGAEYRWYDPDGSPLDERIPRPDEMAWLPERWVRELAAGASKAGPAAAGHDDGQELLGAILQQGEGCCVEMASAIASAQTECTAAEAGTRHDTMMEHVYHAVMLGAEGHPGASQALFEMQGLWTQLTAGEDRGAEFDELVTTAARKAVTKLGGTSPVGWDPCVLLNAAPYQAPVPDHGGAGPDAPEPQPAAPPRYWSPFDPRTGIGTWPFEPMGDLDATLARDVLARTWPVLRFAPDAGCWIVRGPDKWDVRRGELGKWGVDLVSWLMLPGDPDAPEGSDPWRQARKRARFCTSASSNAIAQKMSAQLLAGHHQSAVELAELDGEREILWAGGTPYDLRQCGGGPAVSSWTDPGSPHLHSAGVVPELRPAPLWDAFLAAVWPDEDLRAWAVRVLAIAFTGYADKALPILLGETNAGKTQVVTLMMSVLGSYAHAADARLLAPADRSHASIVYALKGRRLSFIDEAPRSGQQAAERLKQITGGAELTGNRMAENPITFAPTHTLILTANPEHEPNLSDAAIRSRVRLVPCEGNPAAVRAARAAIGALDGSAWRHEAPAVLAMMMREAALWLADPQSASNEAAPDSSAVAADVLTSSQDQVVSWLEECEPWEAGTRSRDLFKAFTDSCRQMGIHPGAIWSETRWGRRLSDLGFDADHRRDGKYRPLRVKPYSSHLPVPAGLAGPIAAAASRGGDGSTSHAEPENQTRHQTRHNGESAAHTRHANGSVTGVTSSSPTTHTRTHAHTHTREKWGDPSHPSSRHADPSRPEASAESSGRPESPPEPGSPPEPEIPKKSRKVTKVKTPKEIKPRPDPVLEGPVHQLPVIVMRNPEGGAPLVIPASVAEAREFAELDLAALCVDCETTGYPPGHPDYALRLVQLGGEQTAAVFDPDDEEQRAVIADLVSRARKLHAHSAVADLVPLDLAGLAPADTTWPKMEDSVLIAKLADPSQAGSDENALKKLSLDLLGGYAVSPPAEKAKNALFASGRWLMQTAPLTPREKSGWAMVKKGCETFARYAGSDVLDLGGVVRVLPRPDERVLLRERTVQLMCSRVSHSGLRLDPDRVRELSERENGLKAAAGDLITGRWGIGNPRSARQMAAVFTEMGAYLPRTAPSSKFPQGQPSVSASVLAGLKRSGGEAAELATALLDYRAHATILSLTLDPFSVLCERGDGRARPVIYTIAAATGRMSCRGPNLQQVKREGGYRSCVVADPGYRGISADFASVEIRVAAALSQDPNLMAMIINGDRYPDRKQEFDLHWQVNRQVWKDEATKSTRYGIKRAVFGHMYGGAAEAMADGAEIPLEAARAVKDSLAALAPGYTAWDRMMRARARAGDRAFPAYSGRTIWLPRRQDHAAGNYAIQGTAKELLADALERWQHTPWGGCVILPVHDELIAFVPEAEAEAATEALVACMRAELYGVPIAAEASEPWIAWPDAA